MNETPSWLCDDCRIRAPQGYSYCDRCSGYFDCHLKMEVVERELADLKRRYLTPMFPLVLDDALVKALESRRGTIQASDLLGPARAALVNRRRMAEMLAKSAAGQPWLKCPACGDEWALAGPPTVLADSEADELRKALADERETRAALEAQLVTLRGAVEIGAENERRLQRENERLALDVDGLHLEAQFQRENADRASRSFLTAQGARDVAREETRAARQAALDLGRDLTQQMEMLAEGKQLEQARAEKAEAELAEVRAERDEYRKAYHRAESDLLAEREALRLARRGVDDMKEAGRAAVLREREECASVAKSFEQVWPVAAGSIESAIRARSK